MPGRGRWGFRCESRVARSLLTPIILEIQERPAQPVLRSPAAIPLIVS